MIEEVEEVRSDAQPLPLCEGERLTGREVPVLLERATINVAAEIAKASGQAKSDTAETRTTKGTARRNGTGPRAGGRATAVTTAARPAAPTKVGRNEPCPCGSGKKYKKCHGA